MTPTYEMLKLWFTPARAARFWAKVDKQPGPFGCWLWTGALSDTGHGTVFFEGSLVRFHRLMWVLARERDCPEFLTHNDHGVPLLEPLPLVVRHFMCDNKPCGNPAHLVGGSQGENVHDIIWLHKAYREDQDRMELAAYRENPYAAHFAGESW